MKEIIEKENGKSEAKCKDKIKQVSKAHTQYKLEDGTRVPGATTIVGLLNKPMLIKWANNLGLEGIDSSKYVDKAAKIGTLIHAMVEEYISKKVVVDLDEYSENEIKQAEVGFEKFLEWEKGHEIVPLLNEKQLVSNEYKYGGTLDFYCMLDGRLSLLDFKTGKGIYKDYFVQVSAYSQLLAENFMSEEIIEKLKDKIDVEKHINCPVSQIIILNIGRNKTEEFNTATLELPLIKRYFMIFKNLLDIYYAKKELAWA